MNPLKFNDSIIARLATPLASARQAVVTRQPSLDWQVHLAGSLVPPALGLGYWTSPSM